MVQAPKREMLKRILLFLRSQTFSANTALVLGSQVLRAPLVLFAWAVIGRFLGAQALGKIQIAFLVPMTVSVFIGLGLPVANSYLLGKRKYSVESILGNSLLWSVGASTAAVALLIAAKPFVLRYLAITPELFTATIVWIPLQQIYSVLTSMLLGERRFLVHSWTGLLNGLCMAFGAVLAVLVFKMGLVATTWTLVGTTGVVACYLLWLYLPLQLPSIMPSPALMMDSLTLGLKAYFGNILQFFNYRLAAFIVAYFAGASALGVYAVAYSLTELLWYVPQSVATVLMPVTASSQTAEATSRTSRICRLSITCGLIGGLAMAAAAPIAIPRLLGTEYGKSVALVWLLLPGAVSFILAKIIAADLSGRGRPEFGSYVSFAGLFITVPMNLVLVPFYGATASAIISSVVYFAEATYLLLCYRRLTQASLASLVFLQPRDFSFIYAWQLNPTRIPGR